MQLLQAFLPYIQITISILLIVVIILQRSSASAGAAFGGGDSGGINHTRRGLEKVLFTSAIIFSILFALSALVTLAI